MKQASGLLVSPTAPPVAAHASLSHRLRKHKLTVVASAAVATFLATALLGPWLAPHDPYAQSLANALAPPSPGHVLGTDVLGRDVWSRMIVGARVAALAGLGSVLLAAVCGTALGLVAGYFERVVDAVVMRVIDTLMIIPPVILALVVAAVLGGGLTSVALAIGIALVPTYSRVTRGVVLAVKRRDYVTAARAQGASTPRLLARHVLPQCVSPILVLATLNLGYAILGEAALSFLGAGIAPPEAAWGGMVNDGYRYLTTHPRLSVAPGLAILLTVLSFNIVGDALRDALDPKLRSGV